VVNERPELNWIEQRSSDTTGAVMEKTCVGCNESKPLDDFTWKSIKRGLKHSRCRECTRLQVQAHYAANRDYYIRKGVKRNRQLREEQAQLVMDYLGAHPCVDCGESDVVCLEFDHVRGKKVADIARMLGNYGWGTILAEIAKCEVCCANCHRRRTSKRGKFFRVRNALRP
jgi:hypothetical protein